MPGYLRENGEVGIRDHLLALPSVVCSNRAALEAGRAVGGVSIEHPLGCAQIGADKDQTWRTLVGVGAHPNVRHTVVIGLGCEGVQASTIHQGILDRGRAADVFSIQSAGGTDQAASLAEDVLQNHQPQPVDQVPISASKLLLGVADLKPLGERGEAIVQAFLAAGGRVLRAMTLSHSAPSDHVVNYAEPVPGEGNLWWMRAATGDTETITGLVASGCHLVLAAGDKGRIGGHPVAPVVRVGYDPSLAQALADDIDGMIMDRSADQWVAFLLTVAGGQKTAAEELGAESFAIERLGPTL